MARALEFVITGDSTKLNKALSLSAQKLRALGNEAKHTAKTSSAMFAVTAAGATGSVLHFAKLEHQLAKVAAISRATQKEQEAFKKKALEIEATTEHTSLAAAEALEQLALAGYSPVKAIKSLDGAMRLITVSGMDTSTAIDMLTDTMTMFRLGADKTVGTVDLFTKISQSSTTTIAQLGAAVKNAGTDANDFGISLDQTAAILGVFANQGQKGEEAGTKFRALLMSLRQNSKELKQWGVEVYNANNEVNDITVILDQFKDKMKGMSAEQRAGVIDTLKNVRAKQGLKLAISEVNGGLDAMIFKTKQAEGASEEYQKTLLATTQGSITLFKSALSGVVTTIGDKLAPAFRAVINAAKGILDAFNQSSDTFKGLTAAAVVMVPAFFAIKAALAFLTVAYAATVGGGKAVIASFIGVAGASKKAAVGVGILGKALRLTPFGLIISLAGAAYTAFTVFGASAKGAGHEVSRLNKIVEENAEKMKDKSQADQESAAAAIVAKDAIKEQADALNGLAQQIALSTGMTKKQADATTESLNKQRKALEEIIEAERKKIDTAQKTINSLNQQEQSAWNSFEIEKQRIQASKELVIAKAKQAQATEQLNRIEGISRDINVELISAENERAQKARDKAKAEAQQAAQKQAAYQKEMNDLNALAEQIEVSNKKAIQAERDRLAAIEQTRMNELEIRKAIAEGASVAEINALARVQEANAKLSAAHKSYIEKKLSIEEQALRQSEQLAKRKLELETATQAEIANAVSQNQKQTLRNQLAVKKEILNEELSDIQAAQEAKLALIEEQQSAESALLEEDLQKRKAMLDLHREEEIVATEEFHALMAEMNEEEKLAFIENNAHKMESDLQRRMIDEAGEIEYAKNQEKRETDRSKKEIKNRAQWLNDYKKHGKLVADARELLNKEEVDEAHKKAGMLTDLQNAKNKEAKALGKAAALVQLSIDTARGALAAYVSMVGIPLVGPTLGVAAAAAVVAYGAEKANKIRGAVRGGVVTGGVSGQDTEPFLLSKGETILPADLTPVLQDTFTNMRSLKGSQQVGTDLPSIQVHVSFEGDLAALGEVLEPFITTEQERNGISNV